MANYPQIVAKINPQVIHMSYPRLVDSSCGRTGGQPVEKQWTTGGQPGKTLASSTYPPELSTLSAQPLCI